MQLSAPALEIFFQHLAILTSSSEDIRVPYGRRSFFVKSFHIVYAIIVRRISIVVIRIYTSSSKFLTTFLSYVRRSGVLLRLLFVIVVWTWKFIKATVTSMSATRKLTRSSISYIWWLMMGDVWISWQCTKSTRPPATYSAKRYWRPSTGRP